MTRILALITYRIYPTLMGGQKGVALFYKALQTELSLTAALSKNNALPDSAGFVAERCLYTNKLIFLNLFRIGVLKKLVQRHNINVIIAEHSYAGWLAWLLKRQTGLPFIIHSHNLEALRFQHMGRWWWRLYERYEKWIHQKADFNFFISDADKASAITNFNLDAGKCETITYGIEPVAPVSLFTKKKFLTAIGLQDACNLLFFNGTLDYGPNREAVLLLITEIAPRLKKQQQVFKILISGNRIQPTLKQRLTEHPDILYLDYVPDVNVVYQSTQLFINPILNNTGVKTKMIEAIANNCTVVSTESGAAGIFKKACGSKLIVVADGDWDGFVCCLMEQLRKPSVPTPQAFFDAYLWPNLARKAAEKITTIAQQHAAT